MDGTVIFVCCLLYLLGGCIANLISLNDYPLLTLIFWPVVLVIKLVMEIIELIGDIRDGTLW